MEFLAEPDDPTPDMNCPGCGVGIEAYPDEYANARSLDAEWSVVCPQCGAEFTAQATCTVKWEVTAT